MFLHGFVFALGFGVGIVSFIVVLAAAIVIIEKFALQFQMPKTADEPVDIRRWKQEVTRKSVQDSPRTAS
ncbi:hypothetical protein [Granulicella sp. L60]|uniref:hypothetical protein n=1 Tax=Granulicella sp. L60 TaxID=1641866 RepID=UPI00131C5CD8|nr:hypothetical protein [Granulicella sp. L60]